MLILISYDIVDDRRRAQVAKRMEDYGRRVQKSVFECLLNEDRLLRLQSLLQETIDMEEDSIRYYRICARCRSVIEVHGTGTFTADEPIMLL